MSGLLRGAAGRPAGQDSMVKLEQVDFLLEAQTELLDLAHDAIFVRDVERSVILYWNRGAEELYGYRREDAVGKVSHDLLHTIFPEPLPDIEEAVVRTGQWTGELVQQTREGAEVVVDSRWAGQRRPDGIGRGDPVAFLEVNRDITARKRAEAELASRLRDLSRRNREMEAVSAAVMSISRALDLSQVLQSIVDVARDLLQARYAALGVADGRVRITEFITSGITPEQRAAIGSLPRGHGLLGTLIREAAPLRINRIGDDPRSHGFPPNHPPMTSLLGVPVISRSRVVGDLYLTDKIGAEEFSEDDQNLLTVLAGHAGIAIDNAHLYQDVRDARDQLRSWNRNLEAVVAERTREIEQMSRDIATRVLQAQEEERKRIARELHDETAQSLATLLITLDMVRPHLPEGDEALASGIARFEKLLQRTLDDVRALSHDLRPAILDDVGLVPAIRSLADDWSRTFGVPVQVDAEPITNGRLPADMEIAVFRIVQEALMNAGKYARAGMVHVGLTFPNGKLLLVVQDDGTGFDPEKLQGPTRHGGLGLYGMEERAALLKGTLSIESAPGRGCRVVLVCPMDPRSTERNT